MKKFDIPGWRQLALACVAAGGAAAVGAQQAPVATEPIPVEAFFASPKLNLARMSPSGRWLAAAQAAPGRRIGLQIIDLDGKEPSRFIEASPKDDVSWFRWVGDDWLVFRLVSPADRSVGALYEGLVSVKRDGSSTRLLIDREMKTVFNKVEELHRQRYLEPNHFYMASGAPGTNEVIVGEAQYRDYQYSHTVPKLLNVATGAVRTMLDDAPRASSWTFDAKGRARLARANSEGFTTTWWADKDGKWREISKAPTYEQPFTPVAIDGDDGLLVETAAPGDGSSEIRRFDFATGKPQAAALVATPGFDTIGSPFVDDKTGRVQGLQVGTDGWNQFWFNPQMKALQEKVDAKFAGNVNLIQCRPCDGTGRLLVYTYSDVDPGRYVLYLPSDDKWRLVGEVRPEIDPRRMAPVDFQRIKARDGRDLPVWITRPAGQAGASAKPGPAVVLVHGGPWVRGRMWNFDSEAQFLASRGYVVIEPEFRGSTGYGESHFRAGWKQWGHAMQDDISDALQFAVKQGWADAKRACIMGGSYGGYATLMGLVKDPDQYRCGVAFASVVDPRLMYDFYLGVYSSNSRKFQLPIILGDKVKDAELLKAGAPVELADRIKVPLLLAHGGRDYNVPVEHGERMRDALKQRGKPVEWVVYPEEGHGFFFDQNRFDYYRKVEAFLAKHLK